MRNEAQRAKVIARIKRLADDEADCERWLVLAHIEDRAFGDRDISPTARAELIRLSKDIKAGRHAR